MSRLIYAALASLDGYVADADGNFDRAAPDEDVHQAVNDLQRPIGTLLLGRRMYEVLVAWETMETADQPSSSATSRRSGEGPTRSCTPGPSRLPQRQDADRTDLRSRRDPSDEGLR
jgi:dihydrofolate reductase